MNGEEYTAAEIKIEILKTSIKNIDDFAERLINELSK